MRLGNSTPLQYARLTATPPPKLSRQYASVLRCTCPPSPDDSLDVEGGNVRALYHRTENCSGNGSPMITFGDASVGGSEYAVAASICPSGAAFFRFVVRSFFFLFFLSSSSARASASEEVPGETVVVWRRTLSWGLMWRWDNCSTPVSANWMWV